MNMKVVQNDKFKFGGEIVKLFDTLVAFSNKNL